MKRLCMLALLAGLLLTGTAHAAEFLLSGEAGPEGALFLGEGELLFEDMKGGIFGEAVKILCSLLVLGEYMGPKDWLILSTYPLGGTDPEAGGHKVKCTTQAGICPEPEEEAIHLPWLMEPIAGPRGTQVSTGAGAPGFNVFCGGIAEDQCTSEEGTVGLKNIGNNVVAEFEAVFNEHAWNCTRGGAHEGLIEGSITFKSETAGLAMAVN